MSKNNAFTINLNSLNEIRDTPDGLAEVHADLVVKGFTAFHSTHSGDYGNNVIVQIDLTPLIAFVEKLSNSNPSAATRIMENIAYIDITDGGIT